MRSLALLCFALTPALPALAHESAAPHAHPHGMGVLLVVLLVAALGGAVYAVRRRTS